MRNITLGLCLLLAACQTIDGYYYEASSGRRVDADKELFARFERQKVICEGETSAAKMQSVKEPAVGAVLAERVFRGCMAKNGYDVRPV